MEKIGKGVEYELDEVGILTIKINIGDREVFLGLNLYYK